MTDQDLNLGLTEFILQHSSSQGKPMIGDRLPAGKSWMWPSIFVTAFFPGGSLPGLWTLAKEVCTRRQQEDFLWRVQGGN